MHRIIAQGDNEMWYVVRGKRRRARIIVQHHDASSTTNSETSGGEAVARAAVTATPTDQGAHRPREGSGEGTVRQRRASFGGAQVDDSAGLTS
jgi:hypothetical protein